MDEIMVVTGLVGALVASSYKWGYFVFATVALIFIAYNVVLVGKKHAAAIGPDVNRTYLICGTWTIFLWFLYPIAWGLSEGGNVISPDSEAVFYGVLDIMAKPVFGALLLWGHRNIDPATLGLQIRDYQDTPLNEKRGNNSHVVGGSSQNNGTSYTGNTPQLGPQGASTGVHPHVQQENTTTTVPAGGNQHQSGEVV